MHFLTITVDNPHADNLVVGQLPASRAAESLRHALSTALPGIAYGLAFTTSSSSQTVSTAGTDDALIHLAVRNARSLGIDKTFILFLKHATPRQIMKALRQIPEISEIYCATDSTVELIVVENSQGRGVMGLVGEHSHGSGLVRLVRE